MDSKKVKPGEYFQGTVAQNVYVGNVLAIPRGAQVTGTIVDVKKPGELKGGASIALQLTNLNLGGNSYSLATDRFDTSSPGKGGYTAGNTVGAAALGAVIGAIAGGGPGAAIGAVAGAGVGLGASAATPGPRSVVPPKRCLPSISPVRQPCSLSRTRRLANLNRVRNRLAGRYPPPPTAIRLWSAGGYAPPPPGYAPYPYAYGYPYPYVYAYPRPYVYAYPYYTPLEISQPGATLAAPISAPHASEIGSVRFEAIRATASQRASGERSQHSPIAVNCPAFAAERYRPPTDLYLQSLCNSL